MSVCIRFFAVNTKKDPLNSDKTLRALPQREEHVCLFSRFGLFKPGLCPLHQAGDGKR